MPCILEHPRAFCNCNPLSMNRWSVHSPRLFSRWRRVRLKIQSVSGMITIELSLNSEVKGANEALGSSIQIDWNGMKEEWNCSAFGGTGERGRDV